MHRNLPTSRRNVSIPGQTLTSATIHYMILYGLQSWIDKRLGAGRCHIRTVNIQSASNLKLPKFAVTDTDIHCMLVIHIKQAVGRTSQGTSMLPLTIQRTPMYAHGSSEHCQVASMTDCSSGSLRSAVSPFPFS